MCFYPPPLPLPQCTLWTLAKMLTDMHGSFVNNMCFMEIYLYILGHIHENCIFVFSDDIEVAHLRTLTKDDILDFYRVRTLG